MANFLKRLELSGFKSFANRTVLEFPGGITAIVGPNGSGKSNLVDAIRWLLGEREAKNLRGAKVEDLIFAGTAKRPRVGQAQASLHFENSHKFFPVDSAEVAVLRELRRDGVSKYYLNKAEARLKDLVDFFARARLGTKGLTIVGQGQSDIFIEANPLSRREMIEEMLGLREYQLKKISAENRLKNSQVNLEKAKALIEEILPHLRSLKRQTGRWERRGALQEELKSLEALFFGSQWKELSLRRRELDAEIETNKKDLHALHKEKEHAEAHQRKVEGGQPAERKERGEIKARMNTLLEQQSQVQKDLGRLEAQIELGVSKAAPASSPRADQLIAGLIRIKKQLSEAAGKDFIELEYIIKDAIEEIDSILEEAHAGDDEPERPVPADLKKQLTGLEKELKGIYEELAELKTKEQQFEKHQDVFYQDFKSAVSAVRSVMEKIEKWEAENQKRLFEKERVELRREELVRHMETAGRNPHEFEDFSIPAGSEGDLADLASLERRILKIRGDLASIGEVDEALLKEARETEERYEFLKREGNDLEKAKADLEGLIADLKQKIKMEFTDALGKINEEFNNFFRIMFGGGQAKLKLKPLERRVRTPKAEAAAEEGEAIEETETEEAQEEEPEEGIEVDVKLPRKHMGSLEMLSGGERSLVGIAALFALISVSPPPFLVLDEVDAALDEQNARRFAQILKEFSKKTQFVVVTHNRATMEAADILYGVTLNEDGTSKILSIKLEAEAFA